jgi:hypothetical protein
MRIGLPESSYPFSATSHLFMRSSAKRVSAADWRVSTRPTPVSEDHQ